jgi:hypothetical protein
MNPKKSVDKKIEVEKEKPATTEIKQKEPLNFPVKIRQIVIETDGNDIKIARAETSGKIELIGILQTLLDFLRNSK